MPFGAGSQPAVYACSTTSRWGATGGSRTLKPKRSVLSGVCLPVSPQWHGATCWSRTSCLLRVREAPYRLAHVAWWTARESNSAQLPYQSDQGNQPVTVRWCAAHVLIVATRLIRSGCPPGRGAQCSRRESNPQNDGRLKLPAFADFATRAQCET